MFDETISFLNCTGNVFYLVELVPPGSVVGCLVEPSAANKYYPSAGHHE